MNKIKKWNPVIDSRDKVHKYGEHGKAYAPGEFKNVPLPNKVDFIEMPLLYFRCCADYKKNK